MDPHSLEIISFEINRINHPGAIIITVIMAMNKCKDGYPGHFPVNCISKNQPKVVYNLQVKPNIQDK